MSDSVSAKIQDTVPVLRSKWWTALLVASLMVNLLVAGAAISLSIRMKEFGFPMKGNLVQLIPRKFFDKLPDARRKTLIHVLRNSRDDFKSMRAASAVAALELASVLESPAYDAAAVKAVVDKFATDRESLAGKASAAVVDIIEKLEPAERTLLAATIRERNIR